jgi:sulfite oxidase
MTRYPGKRADMLVHEREPFNAEPPPGTLADSPITPRDAFYVRGHGPVPELDPATWRLHVSGLLERPLVLSLRDLRDGRFAERELVATLQCAGNRRRDLIAIRDIPGEAPWGPGATGTASWRGVSLADILAAAGATSAAQHIAFVGADRSEETQPPQQFGASIPFAKALSDEVLLAYEMNGEPLPPVHGAPLRVVVAGYIGARSVKWLQQIELRREPWDGYFQNTAAPRRARAAGPRSRHSAQRSRPKHGDPFARGRHPGTRGASRATRLCASRRGTRDRPRRGLTR